MAPVLVLAEAMMRPDYESEDEFEADNILTLSEDEFVRVVARCGVHSGSRTGRGREANEKRKTVDNEAMGADHAA
ncbi:MAG: hypothetical protein EPO21_12620 [Chloroflexota bacterium]|nr:MAG: hypothetical protein EPO21_12620 [Chloroflexota bacterium]